jgi:hypothetical protein
MTVIRYIKNEAGQEIDLSAIKSGQILSNITADDYGLKAGDKYKVKFNSGTNLAYIDADGQIDLDGELRADILAHLVWIEV